MAPTNKTVSSSARKRNMRNQLANLQKRALEEENAADKERIQLLEELLSKQDEDIAALTSQNFEDVGIDPMDVDDEGPVEDAVPPENQVSSENEVPAKNQIPAKSEIPVRNKGQPGQEGKEAAERKENDPKKEKSVKMDPTVVIKSIEKDELFVSSDIDSNPDSDSEYEVVDPEYGRALYSRPAPKHSKDAVTVSWCKPSGTELFINQYGKKSAARYRVEKFAQTPEYDLPIKENASDRTNRLGDEVVPGGKPRYTKRHILGIYGVAWPSANARKPGEEDVDLINPDLVENWRNTHTYILIDWKVGEDESGNDVGKKCWEPRSALRARWGNKDADAAIYEAALESEERYMEAKTGKRLATSRSPSVGLARSRVKTQREKSLGARSPTPTPSKASRSRKSKARVPSSMTLEQLKADFLADYFELLGVDSFDELDKAEKVECLDTWKVKKATLAV